MAFISWMNGEGGRTCCDTTSMMKQRGKYSLGVRLSIVVVAVAWVLNKKTIKSRLLPFGSPTKTKERPTFAAVDPSNDSLRLKHGKLKRIFERIDDDSYQERLLKGPETIFFDPDGNMYTINHDANLIQVTDIQPTGTDHEFTANTTLVADVGVGRPLGATFTPDGSTTYMSDMVLGLTRIRNPHDPLSKVELVASSVVDDNGVKTRINLADDVIVGPKTGLVYFTDATVVYPEKDRNLMWDAMYASKIELMIGPTGRLLKYDPVTDKVSILLSDMWFANSVTVDQDERYLLFTESFSLRIGKYYLQGPKEGSVDYLVNGDPSPGYFDGVDCSWRGRKEDSPFCYSVIPSYIVPAQQLLWKLPHPLDAIAKTIIMMLPRELLPKTKPYGGIMVVDPAKSGPTSVVKLLQDPRGQDIAHLTGVTVHDNKLYLGSLHNNFIGVYDLS